MAITHLAGTVHRPRGKTTTTHTCCATRSTLPPTHTPTMQPAQRLPAGSFHTLPFLADLQPAMVAASRLGQGYHGGLPAGSLH